MTMQQLTAAQASPEVPINENFGTLEHQAVYGKRAPATAGLTWGYYGGRWGGLSVADGTLTLTNAATNYLVVAIATGVISVSTTTTNWNDTANYVRVYKLTVAGSVVTAVEDHRAGPGGVHGGTGTSGGSGGTELKGLTFTSDTSSTADSDPGSGKFKWNNATQGSATVLFFDDTTADGVSLTTFWGSLGSAGFIYMQQGDDSTRWQLWKWTATPVDGTGYRKFTATKQAASTTAIATGKVVDCDFSSSGGGGGSLTNFTEGVNTSTPNATVPVVSLTATNAATNVDVAIAPKGTGALTRQTADNTTTGGNKRGTGATDWQASRTAASQVASGNYSTVSGGDNNTASGVESAVGGGVGNVASGAQSAIPGGNANVASATTTFVGGGDTNTASNTNAATLGGTTNTASGLRSAVIGGTSSLASGDDSIAHGVSASTRGLKGARASSGGTHNLQGQAQGLDLYLRGTTTDATPLVLTVNASSVSSNNVLVVPDNAVINVFGQLCGRTSAGVVSVWNFTCAIQRGSGAGTTAMVTSCTPVLVAQSGGASGWALAVTADTTNGALAVTVTGAAATTIRWGVRMQSYELVY